MHVHVLGIGAMGTLVASHLRTAMRQRLMPLMRTRTPRWHVPASVAAYLPDAESLTLTLHMREKAGSRKQDDDTPGFTELTVDREGARMTEKGFEVELASPVDPVQTRVCLLYTSPSPRD